MAGRGSGYLKIKDHQIQSDRLDAVESQLSSVQDEITGIKIEVTDARAEFPTLKERLDYIMKNAGGGGVGGGSGVGSFIRESTAAQEGQVEFTLSHSYTPGGESLLVFRNGILQNHGYDYTEIDGNRVQITRPASEGEVFLFLIAQGGGGGLISYEEIVVPAGLTEIELSKPYRLGQRVIVHHNGILIVAGGDYEEVDGTKLKLNFTTDENDRFVIMVMGEGSGGGVSVVHFEEIEPPAGATILTLSKPYGERDHLFLYRNGVLLSAGADRDYIELDGQQIELTLPSEEEDRYTAVVLGAGGSTPGGGTDGQLLEALTRKLEKSDFKLEVLRHAYTHYAHEACDVLTDDTGIDFVQSSGITYDQQRQRVTSSSGGTMVTVAIQATTMPTIALILWEGEGVSAEISRNDGLDYQAIEQGVLTELNAGEGTAIRLRFTLAANGILDHWGLIWR